MLSSTRGVVAAGVAAGDAAGAAFPAGAATTIGGNESTFCGAREVAALLGCDVAQAAARIPSMAKDERCTDVTRV
jgi:hypothetical protein